MSQAPPIFKIPETNPERCLPILPVEILQAVCYMCINGFTHYITGKYVLIFMKEIDFGVLPIHPGGITSTSYGN
jgi:hypothetical protein